MTFIAKKLTIEEIRNSDWKSYNPTQWDKNIDSYLKYENVQFYIVNKGDGYDYDRYFVEYTLNEGLRLFGSFSYGGSLTNGGFYRLDKFPITDKGLTHADLVNLNSKEEVINLLGELQSTNLYQISYGKFYDSEGNECLYSTTSQARARMTELSRKNGMTFTKG